VAQVGASEVNVLQYCLADSELGPLDAVPYTDRPLLDTRLQPGPERVGYTQACPNAGRAALPSAAAYRHAGETIPAPVDASTGVGGSLLSSRDPPSLTVYLDRSRRLQPAT
jgi:hypothetical protein